MTAAVTIMASQAGSATPGNGVSATGMVPVINPTRVRAANRASTPWAKLNTPEALKISTKPSATSEYITPDIRPPMITSAKNDGASTICTKGSAKTR